MKQLEILSQDLRYSIRSICRQPGLSLALMLTLALGLGLNVSVFTVLEGMLFRARVERSPQTFAHLSPEYSGENGQHESSWSVSAADYREYAGRAKTLSPLAAWSTVHARV